jgi:hypothetical protein
VVGEGIEKKVDDFQLKSLLDCCGLNQLKLLCLRFPNGLRPVGGDYPGSVEGY